MLIKIVTIGPLDCCAMLDCDDFYQHLAEGLELADSTWRSLRSALRQDTALILIDEFDSAPALGFTVDDLGRFRALCGYNPRLHLITATRTPPKELFPDTGIGSPAYNFLIPFTLGPLTQPEADQLLTHPWASHALDFDALTRQQLLDLAQTHPFRLQRAAFHRYEAMADSSYAWQAAYRQDLELLQ